MTSPKVVVKNKYTPSYNNLNFHYRTKQAVHTSTMNMFDYFADIKKKAFYMFDYFSGKIGKDKETNIIFENGEYATENEIELRKHQYEKYVENSNVFKLIISFPEGYLEQSVNLRKFEKKMAKEIIPEFLKKCGFVDIKKMSYQLSLHTNTDNLHFHVSFAEKQPNYKSYGKIGYRNKGKLTQEELRYFKNLVLHHIHREKILTPLIKEANEEIENLKKYFNPEERNFILKDKDNILLEEKIYKLGCLLEKKHNSGKKIKYNSIKDIEIINLTKEIKRDIFIKKDSDFKEEYKLFKNTLNKINDYFYELSKENNFDSIDKTLSKNKEKYLDNYILNAIVNHANSKYKNKDVKEEELIHAIVYKEFKKMKNKTKFDILSSFLSNTNNSLKFRNQYQIKQAVRNINDELEEAEKEFDKLFKVEKEYE